MRGKIDVPATEGNYADELLSQIWKHSIESPNRPAFVSLALNSFTNYNVN